MKSKILAAALLALAITGCGASTDETPEQNEQLQCETGEYVAFDPLNHAAQDARLAAFAEMMNLFKAAQEDPTLAAAKADEIRALYEGDETKIQEKVLGRTDMHFTGEDAAIGVELDAVFQLGLTKLAAATTAQEVAIAKQLFQKGGMYRFLYLSVMEELSEPSRKHYDEAFGYLGTGYTNDEAGRQSIASVAAGRDASNGTSLNTELFQLIIDGRCAIDAALTEAGTETIELHDERAEAYHEVVHEMDEKMQLVFAYSVGHELHEMVENVADTEKFTLEMYEAHAFFMTVEPYLLAGTEAQVTFATTFRTALNAAMVAAEAGDETWIGTFDAGAWEAQIEQLYTIDIKG